MAVRLCTVLAGRIYGSVLTKIQHFLSYIAVPDVSRLKIQERPVVILGSWALLPPREKTKESFILEFILSITSLYIWEY